MLNLQDATRKPFPVQFEQVTLDNIEELAAWCGGAIEQRNTRMLGTTTKLPVIILTNKDRGRSDEAALGCYIVGFKGSYRVYKPAVFEATFDVKGAVTDEEMLKLAVETVSSTTGHVIDYAELDREPVDLTAADCEA